MSSLTDAGLCNLALLKIGEKQIIDSLEQNNAPAKACKVLFATTRDKILESVPWSFATKRVTLAELETSSRDGWEYVYTAPSDMLAPQYIWMGVRNPPPEARIPFAIELNDDDSGQVVLCDLSPASLVYTKALPSLATWSNLACDAFAWALAAELALALPIKPALGLQALRGAKAALATAWAADARKGQEDQLPDSELITVRGL